MTIDFTGVVVAIIGGFFSILALVVNSQIQARMTNKASAAVLEAAVNNSLGAMQQASEAAAKGLRPVTIPIKGVPAELTVGVQYVLDHAGTEAGNIGITPAAIADKINAKIGLASISSNIAAAASPAPTPAPLAVVPVGDGLPIKTA